MVDPISFGRTKVNPMDFGRTKVDPLKVGELLLILLLIIGLLETNYHENIFGQWP